LKTLSQHFSLKVSDQVSHSYKTTGKITVLYMLIFTFLDSKCTERQQAFHDFNLLLISYIHSVCLCVCVCVCVCLILNQKPLSLRPPKQR
jgi:hypothetical protein